MNLKLVATALAANMTVITSAIALHQGQPTRPSATLPERSNRFGPPKYPTALP